MKLDDKLWKTHSQHSHHVELSGYLPDILAPHPCHCLSKEPVVKFTSLFIYLAFVSLDNKARNVWTTKMKLPLHKRIVFKYNQGNKVYTNTFRIYFHKIKTVLVNFWTCCLLFHNNIFLFHNKLWIQRYSQETYLFWEISIKGSMLNAVDLHLSKSRKVMNPFAIWLLPTHLSDLCSSLNW